MKRQRHDFIGTDIGKAGTVFVLDDSIWLTGTDSVSRIAFIRMETDQTWSVLAQATPTSVQKRIHHGPHLTDARAALNRLAKKEMAKRR